jgi:hypothetical protein
MSLQAGDGCLTAILKSRFRPFNSVADHFVHSTSRAEIFARILVTALFSVAPSLPMSLTTSPS